MANIKKVITHLVAEESIARVCKKDFASVDVDILSDAIELLKEQAHVEPIGLFLEVLEKYKESESSRIWERSTHIRDDLKELDEEISKYKKLAGVK